VRLANEERDLHDAGAEIVAVSVDSPGRNEALRARWRLPFPIVSDPAGDELLQPLGVWNPDERGGIGWPAVIVFAPDGREVYRMRSRDFADRPDDDDLFTAIRALGLPPIELGPADPAASPEEDDAALRVDAFGPYFRGIRFGTIALAGRVTEGRDRDEVIAMSTMAASFLDAWKQRRATA
jgi:hypothetical protein